MSSTSGSPREPGDSPLARTDGLAGLRDLNSQLGVPGDATNWIIPGERMDYDMAIDSIAGTRGEQAVGGDWRYSIAASSQSFSDCTECSELTP